MIHTGNCLLNRLASLTTVICISIGLLSCSSQKSIRVTDGFDETAGNLPAFIIEIDNATFYLEKTGGGLSSMLDADGVDWIGFNNTPGSGWQGEYRGFPNAVHKQDGNYFHAMNAKTDPASTNIVIQSPQHVRIAVSSANGKWIGQYDFYRDRLDFTMTQVSAGYYYWVQFEGVPNGQMDESDFWFASIDSKSHPINEPFLGDLPAPEWFAFGDASSPRMLYVLHHEDDQHPDNYVSRPYMTVLGFGRSEKNKYLNTPQRFSIGFIESTEHTDVTNTVNAIAK